jgi:hypothetical protein
MKRGGCPSSAANARLESFDHQRTPRSGPTPYRISVCHRSTYSRGISYIFNFGGVNRGSRWVCRFLNTHAAQGVLRRLLRAAFDEVVAPGEILRDNNILQETKRFRWRYQRGEFCDVHSSGIDPAFFAVHGWPGPSYNLIYLKHAAATGSLHQGAIRAVSSLRSLCRSAASNSGVLSGMPASSHLLDRPRPAVRIGLGRWRWIWSVTRAH